MTCRIRITIESPGRARLDILDEESGENVNRHLGLPERGVLATYAAPAGEAAARAALRRRAEAAIAAAEA